MKEVLMLIAEELDEAVGDIAFEDIKTQEVYRLLMAAQAAIVTIKLNAVLLEAITEDK